MIKDKARSSTLITSVPYIVEILTKTVMPEKINKRYKNWKKQKLKYLFTEDMVVYVENSQGPSKQLLKLMSELSKVIGNKVCIQKTVVFLYTSGNQLVNEIVKFIFHHVIKQNT